MPAKLRVIVIGGSGTLGSVLCGELTRQGAQVGLTFHQGEARARLVCERHGARAARLDVTASEQIPRTLDLLSEQLGGLDAVVYAAAITSAQVPSKFDALEDVTAAGWDRVFSVNVRGPFLVAQHAARLLSGSGGNLVLLGSIDGVKPMPGPVPYAASKGALVALAGSLAKALGSRNIRVNVVAPGVLTEGASRNVPDDLRSQYLLHCALKRVGTLEEAARVVSFFALRNTYVTGQTIPLDGGL